MRSSYRSQVCLWFSLYQLVLVAHAARLLKQAPATALTGKLEVLDITRPTTSAAEYSAVETTEQAYLDASSLNDDVSVEDTVIEQAGPVAEVKAQVAANRSSTGNATHADVEYILNIDDGAGVVSRKRIFFSSETLPPTSQISSGWTISVLRARPAAPVPEGAAADYEPQEDTTYGASIAKAGTIIVDDWVPVGAPVSAMSAEASVWPPPEASVWDVTTVTYILNFPQSKPAVTPQSIAGQWFRSQAPSSSSPTLDAYYSSCSYSKYRFSQANQKIINVPINIPASGRTPSGADFSSSTCSSTDRYAWAEWAENYVNTTLKIDGSAYGHRIFIFNNPACTFTGQANMACVGQTECRVWLNTYFTNNQLALAAVFHELGHNYGLDHAATTQSTYGDQTCAMGDCCSNRCYNTPHSYQLGWSSPVDGGDMTSANMIPGTWTSFNLPSQILRQQNFIKIDASTWLGGVDDAPISVYVGYRTARGYDRSMNSTVVGKVSIYTWTGVTRPIYGGPVSQLIGSISAQTMFDDTTNLLRIRTGSFTSTSATVTVCRFRSDPSECQ